MEFNIFDIVVGSVILLLGLKGIINGFFKELFGLFGIVGGIFIGSRVATNVGTILSDAIFKFDSPAAINLLGFIVTLALFWGAMIAAGTIFKKFSKMSGLGLFDKILGFVVGSGKFFFIAAVIVYAVYNFKAVRENINMKGSIIFPILVETGSFIMHMDTTGVVSDINNTIDTNVEKLKQNMQDDKTKKLLEAAKEEKEAIKKVVKEKLQEHNISIPMETK